MSAIQPHLPPIQTPTPSGSQAPARASRADFFRAALDAVAPAGTEPAAQPAPPPSTATAAEARPMRPGALLDIRV